MSIQVYIVYHYLFQPVHTKEKVYCSKDLQEYE